MMNRLENFIKEVVLELVLRIIYLLNPPASVEDDVWR